MTCHLTCSTDSATEGQVFVVSKSGELTSIITVPGPEISGLAIKYVHIFIIHIHIFIIHIHIFIIHKVRSYMILCHVYRHDIDISVIAVKKKDDILLWLLLLRIIIIISSSSSNNNNNNFY